jgi:uncharacterized protein YcaQ
VPSPGRPDGSVLTASAEAARRFFVARHMLAPARSVDGGPNGILEVVGRLGSLQFDPITVAGRNHDLVLHARVAGYERAWCDQLLYGSRDLFEAYNKGLSLLPMDELPWYRVSWTQTVNSPRVLAENAEVAERTLARIRAEGPLSALDFDRGPSLEWWLARRSTARAVLESLAATGVLGLARREGNRRYYDLVERLYPAGVLARKVPRREQLKHKVLSRFRGHGLLGLAGSGDAWIGTGPARPDRNKPDWPSRTEFRQELVDEGTLIPVNVEGVRGTRFVLREEQPLLEAPPEPPPSVTFLAPLDQFVWDRDLLRTLFGFDYVWEVYVPEPKRRWGYYVLPLLFRDRIVGRIEPRIDRNERRVRVLGLWWEQGFEPKRGQGFVEAMREALAAYLGFAGAETLEWAPHLTREKRLFPVDSN